MKNGNLLKIFTVGLSIVMFDFSALCMNLENTVLNGSDMGGQKFVPMDPAQQQNNKVKLPLTDSVSFKVIDLKRTEELLDSFEEISEQIETTTGIAIDDTCVPEKLADELVKRVDEQFKIALKIIELRHKIVEENFFSEEVDSMISLEKLSWIDFKAALLFARATLHDESLDSLLTKFSQKIYGVIDYVRQVCESLEDKTKVIESACIALGKCERTLMQDAHTIVYHATAMNPGNVELKQAMENFNKSFAGLKNASAEFYRAITQFSFGDHATLHIADIIWDLLIDKLTEVRELSEKLHLGMRKNS